MVEVNLVKRKIRIHFKTILTVVILMLVLPSITCAGEDNGEYIPTRKGIALTFGRSYNPRDGIDFFLLSGFYLFDYDRVWKHKAPESLRFKVEGTAGIADYNKTRLVTSANIFALYYLDFFKTEKVKPYVEAGIGIIYTDFQVRGQGSRVNFNPQMGLGAEFETRSDETFFFAVRVHHLSNANLCDENRGVNSVMCMFGFYF